MTKILVVDSERAMRNTLKERLEYEGYKVTVAENCTQGLDDCDNETFDVVLCEYKCCGAKSEHSIACLAKSASLIIISDDNSTVTAVAAIRDGAYDYLTKPIDMTRLRESIHSLLSERSEESDHTKTNCAPQLRGMSKKSSHVERIVGESCQIGHVKRLIEKVAPSEARVLITGANGTGKELVARWLHELSPRSGGPFIEVNCAAIPSELIESELFGHEKGAFTSAIKQRKGKFEQANGGTIFMDEIGDMSLSAQAKVLRVLQEHKISRVGSDKDVEVDVRVLAATNKNLFNEIEHGNFREDLYHRLSVIVISVPPLAQRADDIPMLVDYFNEKICAEYSIPKKDIEPSAINELMTLAWTGNIRELRNVIERLIILSGNCITLDDVKRYALGVV